MPDSLPPAAGSADSRSGPPPDNGVLPADNRRRIEDAVGAVAMALLALITFTNVVVRYLTNESFAWSEELSVSLMVVLTLVAGSAAVVRDRHIRIELFFESGSIGRRRSLALFSALTMVAAFLILASLGYPAGLGRLPVRGHLTRHRRSAVVVHDLVARALGADRLSRDAALHPYPHETMISVAIFVVFVLLMLAGVPIGAALMLGGAVGIGFGDLGWFSIPNNFYAGIAKYPLLALPMFVLVGTLFERSGVARRLVDFAVAIVGRGPGMLPIVAIGVAMFMGGISGSGPATAAAVGAVMLVSMGRAGYPPAYSASVIGAAAALDILIPPSIAFIVYSVLVPGASVPALFAAGIFPGILAGLGLMIPAYWLARRHGMGTRDADEPRPPFLKAIKDASWGLFAPVLILGGMRLGWFTPTEAAVVAVFYGLFVGTVVYRTIGWRELWDILVDAAETSGVIMIIIGLASIFAYAVSTLGIVDPLARAVTESASARSVP